MPVYTFQCQNCQKVFDIQATFKEKADGLKPHCPECQSKKTRQLLTAGLFLRKSDDGAPLTMPNCGPDAGPGCC